jgi:signal transduction histidine kinase/CheY-like chemotaxis protein
MKFEVDFVLQNADWPALLMDASGVVRGANRAAVATFGAVLEGEAPMFNAIWSPENETALDQFLVRVDRAQTAVAPVKFHVKGGGTAVFKTHICSLAKDGQKYFIFQLFRETSALSPAVQTSAFPHPQEHGADASAAQKQKLECALQLSRTVALDFNNALTSILGHTSLILSQMEPGHPWRSSLVEVEKSAEKAAEIANDLASFSRQDKEAPGNSPGNLNQLLRRTVELYQTPGAHNASWSLQLESKLFTASFDEAKMQQAFMKILDNAVQAPGENRRITVRSGNQTLSEPTPNAMENVSTGNHIFVEISDNGSGIPADVLPRIFEPFFTTKPGHRGLGLAWVYGIVTNHGGGVKVLSQLGQGTTVSLFLPARKKIVKDSDFHDNNLTGNQTILMVDDEDILLTMGQMILSSFGYRVLTANSGEKALEVFKNSSLPIDLVITDLVMPKMSGRELIENLRRISPAVPIICTSGYLRSSSRDDEALYLQKPFNSQDLLRKVKEVLT